jgi:DNA-binding MarR family transcriptional regulator
MTDTPPNRALRDALRRLVVAHGTLDDARRPCGTPLPMPHAWALLELSRRAMTVTELASRLNIDRTNVSRLCAKMESAGELARRPHPEDGRARLVELTPAGARLAAQVDTASAEHFDAVVARLGADASDTLGALEALTRALTPPADEEETL